MNQLTHQVKRHRISQLLHRYYLGQLGHDP